MDLRDLFFSIAWRGHGFFFFVNLGLGQLLFSVYFAFLLDTTTALEEFWNFEICIGSPLDCACGNENETTERSNES